MLMCKMHLWLAFSQLVSNAKTNLHQTSFALCEYNYESWNCQTSIFHKYNQTAENTHCSLCTCLIPSSSAKTELSNTNTEFALIVLTLLVSWLVVMWKKRLHEYEWEGNQTVRRCPSGASVGERCKWTVMALEYVNTAYSWIILLCLSA